MAQLEQGFWRITFDTNPNDCNLHCIMCEHHSKYSAVETNRIAAGNPKAIMPIQLIRKVLASAKNSRLREIIPSTMGEPLLYENFPEFIELCKEFHVKLNLTTNGTFPLRGAIAWANLIIPVTSDVKISWNGATKKTQEKIMQGSNFEQGIQNIKDFVQVRNELASKSKNYCQITLQLTFMETNFCELEDIIKLAITLGVDRVKGHHLWINFEELTPLSLRRNSDSIAKWNEAVINIRNIVVKNRLSNGKLLKLANFEILDETATRNLSLDGVCPFLGKEAWIAPDGRFSPCCAPDLLRRKLGEFGNVNDKNVLDIWQNEAYQALIKNYMQNEVCVACNMRRPKEICEENTYEN